MTFDLGRSIIKTLVIWETKSLLITQLMASQNEHEIETEVQACWLLLRKQGQEV